MATEDVVIRLRVDDSELRRARRGYFDVPSSNVPTSGLTGSATASFVIAGVAGSITRNPSSAGGRNLLWNQIVDAELDGIAPGLRRDRVGGILGNADRDAIKAGVKDFAAEAYYRGYDFGDGINTQMSHRAKMFSAGWRADSPVWLPELETVRNRIDINNLIEQNGSVRRPGAVSGTAAVQREIGHIVGSGGAEKPLSVPRIVFTEPLLREKLNTGLTGPGIIGRTASAAKDFGSNIKGSAAYQNFMPGMLGGKVQQFPAFGTVTLDGIKDIAGRLGIITSAGGSMAVAKQMSDARTAYFKKLMITGEQPDANYLNLGFKRVLSGMQETTSNLVANILYEVPSVLFEGISIGTNFLAKLAGFSGWDDNLVGMAVDMVGMDFKEALGLTEEDYGKVAEAQSAWNKAYKSLQEQTRAQARRSSDDVAQRMQGLGADGVSLDELSKSIYKNVEKKMLIQADQNFNSTNPFPTSRDVNPYGTDGGSDLADYAMGAWGLAARGISALFD